MSKKVEDFLEDKHMNEDEWYNTVDALLEEKGLSLNTSSDGWDFCYGNGLNPESAIAFMLES